MGPSGANPGSSEQLAPVTWLFGAPPAIASEDHSSADPTRADPAVAQPNPVSQEARALRGSFDPISNVSMSALARRGMSAEEMSDYLLGRDFEDGDVELECERLLSVGLLDDFALAQTLVRTLRARKGLGGAALTTELRRRRLDPDAIEEALEDLDVDDELERATAIAQRRAPQLRSLDQITAKRRLGAFLMRKGYSGSVVSTAVARALEPSGPRFR